MTTIYFLLILVLMVLCFAIYFFRGSLKPNEKKSIGFKFWLFTFSANHEKGSDLDNRNSSES